MTQGAAADVANARRVVYRTLASLLLPPTEERVTRAVRAAPELRELTEPLEGFEPFAAWESLLSRLEQLEEGGTERLNREHTMLFLSGSPGLSVPPYESAHVKTPEFGQAMLSAQVESCYRAAGLAMAEVAGGELPDHLSAELEFLAFLCHREAESASEQAARWRAEQLAFLGQHLLRWVGVFETRLRVVAPDAMATHAVAVARSFAEHDILLLEAIGSGLAG